MNEIERKARELLEIECRREDTTGGRMMADNLRDGETHGFEVELRAIVAALTPPEGFVLVPVEPTPAMSAAGFCVSEADHDPAGVYRAMLAARPEVSP